VQPVYQSCPSRFADIPGGYRLAQHHQPGIDQFW
jgi:hypothetical protein